MCDKVVHNYPHALNVVPDCYITQKMFDKVVNTYHTTIKLAPECYKAREMRGKVVNRCFLHLIMFLIDIKLKKCISCF